MRTRIACLACLLIAGCGGSVTPGEGPTTDAGADGTADTSRTDAPLDAPVDAPPPDVACTDCVGGTLAWGSSGGFVFREEGSSVTPCRTYEHHRGPPGGGPPDATCTQELAACGVSGGVMDVNRALAEPDVIAAFAAAPIMYGEVVPDGGTFILKLGDEQVSVAFDCTSGRPDCKPIPPGVKRAIELLAGVDNTQLATGSCKGVFGAGP